jgi:hypothetical protein
MKRKNTQVEKEGREKEKTQNAQQTKKNFSTRTNRKHSRMRTNCNKQVRVK